MRRTATGTTSFVCLVCLLALAVFLLGPVVHDFGWASAVQSLSRQSNRTRTGESDVLTHSTRRDDRSISFRVALAIPMEYSGAAGFEQILKTPHVRPLSLGSGDFDGDGVLARISQCAFSARTPCGRKEPTYVVVGKHGS